MTESNLDYILSTLSEIKRPGMPEFLEWLKCTDIRTAPASTKYHLSHPGGWMEHAINVYDTFSKINQDYKLGLTDYSVAIVSLLHDVCKLNYYKEEFTKRDNKRFYKVEDPLPLGHGEKSVIMILEHGLKLTDEEKMIIRWHMSHYDPGTHFFYPNGAAFGKAKEVCPAVVAFSCADLMCSYVLEKRGAVE